LHPKIVKWQRLYLRVVKRVSTPVTWSKTIHALRDRAQVINHEGRITGNALIHIVDEILRCRRRGLSDAEIQAAIEGLIGQQTLNPDFVTAEAVSKIDADPKKQPILRNFLSVVHGFREDI
jgi:hypothetical protein